MNTVPLNILNLLSLKDKLPFYIRTAINWIQIRFHIRLKRAVMNSRVLLVSTTEIKDKVRRRFKITSQYLPENGILELKRTAHFSFNLESGIVNLVWIGSLDSRKYLDLLLEALNQVISKNWKLNVIGSGPRQKELVNRSSVLGLSNNIVWHGNIPRSSVFEILKDMHLNIITSLSEGNPTTLWEVMSFNIPTITLNHCGMKDVVCNRCGIKIDITNINQIIKDVSSNIEHLLKNPNEIIKLSEGVKFCSQTHLWSERVKKIDFMYKSVIHNN
jgi:glycosyltransferase involved in cell wall biosynthesis